MITEVTLVVTLLFSILTLRVNPGTAMGLIISCMMVWPEYLRIPVGPAAMSAPRLVAMVLLVRLLVVGRRMHLKTSLVDKLVIGGWLWTILATLIAGADFGEVSQMIGRGFDTVLMYFVARLTLMSVKDAKKILTPLAITAYVMCLIGILEATMLYFPYKSLQIFREWTWVVETGLPEMRFGFLRAQTSTSQSIYFGMAMMLIAGMLWSIRGYGKTLIFNPGSMIAAFFGALTSFSSGPWIGCVLLLFFNAFIKRVSLIKPILIIFILFLVSTEIASNRHFYHLIDYLALNNQTAWYRTRLLEVAISQWRDFWLFGAAGNTPHHWGAMIDGRHYVDLVNHFLILALYGGLPGLIMYFASHVVAVRASVSTWQLSGDDRHRKMIFGFSATLIALDVTSMSVGIFGPALLLSYILLGFSVSVTGGLRQKINERRNCNIGSTNDTQKPQVINYNYQL